MKIHYLCENSHASTQPWLFRLLLNRSKNFLAAKKSIIFFSPFSLSCFRTIFFICVDLFFFTLRCANRWTKKKKLLHLIGREERVEKESRKLKALKTFFLFSLLTLTLYSHYTMCFLISSLISVQFSFLFFFLFLWWNCSIHILSTSNISGCFKVFHISFCLSLAFLYFSS